MPTFLTIFDFLEEDSTNTPAKEKTYDIEEIRAYINEHYNSDIAYHNDTFKNIIMLDHFTTNYQCGFKVPPKEQFENFKELYNGFTYHFQNEKFKVFSLHRKWENAPDEYELFIAVKDDYIVKLPRVENIFEDYLYAPACGISWYTKEGEFVPLGDYMRLKEGEVINADIKASQNQKDRRNYYFFNLLGVNQYGQKRNFARKSDVFECFCDYEWKYKDMIDFMVKAGGNDEI